MPTLMQHLRAIEANRNMDVYIRVTAGNVADEIERLRTENFELTERMHDTFRFVKIGKMSPRVYPED